jgi:hypothetical protein
MTHWAMPEMVDGLYWSERCRLVFAAGGDCCDTHCPNDYEEQP